MEVLILHPFSQLHRIGICISLSIMNIYNTLISVFSYDNNILNCLQQLYFKVVTYVSSILLFDYNCFSTLKLKLKIWSKSKVRISMLQDVRLGSKSQNRYPLYSNNVKNPFLNAQ